MDRPEALAQLARLVGEGSLRSAEPEVAASAVDARFDRVVDGLLAEAAASDDVTDRQTALEFLDDRLASFAAVLDAGLRARLREALAERIALW